LRFTRNNATTMAVTFVSQRTAPSRRVVAERVRVGRRERLGARQPHVRHHALTHVAFRMAQNDVQLEQVEWITACALL